MKTENCKQACEGCALTPGAAANLEIHNNLRAQICVLGGMPFFCHEGLEWSDPNKHNMTAAEFRATRVRVCQGWVREVRKLADAGYFKKHKMIARALAEICKDELAVILFNGSHPDDKADAHRVLRKHFTRLHKMRKAFEV